MKIGNEQYYLFYNDYTSNAFVECVHTGYDPVIFVRGFMHSYNPVKLWTTGVTERYQYILPFKKK